ncbi:MAG: sensor histidine kinase [Janthinobacterium lividum]
MRSLFAKLFFCMLLVPVLARGSGLLLQATLGDNRPDIERAMGAALPLYAQAIGAVMDRDGPAAAEALVAAAQQAGPRKLSLHLSEPSEGGCASLAVPAASGESHQSLAVPIPLTSQPTPACLVATLLPRPRLFGVLPGPWWTLMPLVELAICAVVSFFLARYLARPIRRLRVAAAAFAGGDLTARAGRSRDKRRDEAADLVSEFDHMADRVAASLQGQRRFIDDVSHEIKSPLARLSMALGLARREAGGAGGPRFDRMERELDTVSRLVRELLVLSSLQGAIEPEQSVPVDLAATVQEAIDNVTFEWRERAQCIHLIRHGGPIWVSGDAALLRRVAENVLANALFYTPDGTDVEALLDRQGPWARLVVRDRGPGVPPGALPHLFEPFFRVDAARARNTGGAGLGLAICERAVALHGGRISAANATPGLRINVELPALETGAEGLALEARKETIAVAVAV